MGRLSGASGGISMPSTMTHHHLILWDPARLDIIAHRFAPVARTAGQQGWMASTATPCSASKRSCCPGWEQAIELMQLHPARLLGQAGARLPLVRHRGSIWPAIPNTVTCSGPSPSPAACRQRPKDLLVSFYRQHFAPALAPRPSCRPLSRHADAVRGHDYGTTSRCSKAGLDNSGLPFPTL